MTDEVVDRAVNLAWQLLPVLVEDLCPLGRRSVANLIRMRIAKTERVDGVVIVRPLTMDEQLDRMIAAKGRRASRE